MNKMRVTIIRQYPEVVYVDDPKKPKNSRRQTYSRRQMQRNAKKAQDRSEKEREIYLKEAEKERREQLDTELKNISISRLQKLTDGASFTFYTVRFHKFCPIGHNSWTFHFKRKIPENPRKSRETKEN